MLWGWSCALGFGGKPTHMTREIRRPQSEGAREEGRKGEWERKEGRKGEWESLDPLARKREAMRVV